MNAITVEHPARIRPEDFIAAIWSGDEWRANWSPTLDFTVDYDDSEHQALRLRINWHGKPVEMSIMRFRESATRIEFFCPRPPEGLIHQTGTWRAEAGADGTCNLIATRDIALTRTVTEKDDVYRERQERYCVSLSERLRLILRAFSAENSGDAS